MYYCTKCLEQRTMGCFRLGCPGILSVPEDVEITRLRAENEALKKERDQLLATPADKREDLRCVIADISAQCAALWAERDQLRAELQNSQNRLKASGWAKLREEVSQLRAELAECGRDAERYRDALVSIEEYWNRDQNEKAMADACWHAVETAAASLAADGEGK